MIRRTRICASTSSDIVAYKSSSAPISKQFNRYSEIGLHCGTFSQALSIQHAHDKTNKIYQITFHPLKIFKTDIDIEEGWIPELVMRYIIYPYVTKDRYNELFYDMRESYNKNEFVRKLFLDKGYDCIEYLNTVEGESIDTSYIILNTDIILDVDLVSLDSYFDV